MKVRRGFGWVPDLPDQRDYLYGAIRPVVRLPKEVDLREFCSEVENQEALGSCTANALAGNLEFLDKRGIDQSDSVSRLRRLTESDYTDVSRLFIYYNERVLHGTVDYDSGASLRNGIKTLRKEGACWEETWPYLIERFTRKPPEKCYREAKKHCIESYHRISNLSEMLTCLADGFPFVFGFMVYESFQTQRVARTGKVNMPGKKEKPLGGHAVLAVGYNQKDERFLVRNSWGSEWGKDGYFTMPYKYLETLSADFWTIRK
ncbi:MAG: C1 family peptidase [Candidatus Omnitrophota bacterium]|nr:C1 family peptidase [Candidatus Omnitrophota bacterium]